MPIEKNIERLQSIDALRGLVILIMLLDHVRETFYLHKQVTDPMDVTVTEPALFGSRLLAHICAPVFVLLTGISAFLFQSKKTGLTTNACLSIKTRLIFNCIRAYPCEFCMDSDFSTRSHLFTGDLGHWY